MDPLNVFKPYRSAYIDTKLPEIAQIRRDRYDKAAAEYDDLQRKIGSIRTISAADEAHKNRLQMDIDSLMSGNIGFENMDRMIQNATTRVLTDEPLLNALDSYDVRKKELANIAQGTLEGKQYVRFDQPIKKDPLTGLPEKDDSGNPVYSPLSDMHDSTQGVYQPKAEEYISAEPEIQKIMQQIASDAIFLGDPVTRNMSAAERMFYLMDGDKVSEEKVRRIADNSLENLLNTQAGKQLKRSLMTLQINEATGDTYTSEEADMYMRQLLFDAAKKQAGSKVNYREAAWMKGLDDDSDKTSKEGIDIFASTRAGEEIDKFEGLVPTDSAGSTNEWLANTLTELVPEKTDPRVRTILASEGKKLIESKGGLGKMSKEDLSNENIQKQIVAYVLDDSKDVNGLGKLRTMGGSGFENMSDEEFASAVLKSITTTPEVLQEDIQGENMDIVMNEMLTKMGSQGVITLSTGESFNMDSQKSRDAFYDFLGTESESGLDVKGWSIFGGNEEKEWFNEVTKAGYKDGVKEVKKGTEDAMTISNVASIEYTGEHAGEIRFLLDFQDQKLEVYYSLYKDQTEPFEAIRQLYKDINAKDLASWDKPKKLADKELVKTLFGDDAEYTYKVRPTAQGTFEPVFYKNGARINVPWNRVVQQLASAAVEGVKHNDMKTMMASLREKERESKRTID